MQRQKELPYNLSREESTTRISYGLGRLAAIKQVEALQHGDYTGRHILFNPFTPADQLCDPRLSVIDVESTKQGDVNLAKAENTLLREKHFRIFSEGPKHDLVVVAYNDGFSSLPSNTEPIWVDAYYTARNEFDLE